MSEPSQESGPLVRFPEMPNGPAVFYDDERSEVWVGIPFKQMDNAIFVTAFLDRAKFDTLAHLQKHQMKMIEESKKNKLHLPGRVKKSISDIMGKAKSLIS